MYIMYIYNYIDTVYMYINTSSDPLKLMAASGVKDKGIQKTSSHRTASKEPWCENGTCTSVRPRRFWASPMPPNARTGGKKEQFEAGGISISHMDLDMTGY